MRLSGSPCIPASTNGLQQHFGQANVQVWRVAIGSELGQGPAVAGVFNASLWLET
jgi:hypothetical protein